MQRLCMEIFVIVIGLRQSGLVYLVDWDSVRLTDRMFDGAFAMPLHSRSSVAPMVERLRLYNQTVLDKLYWYGQYSYLNQIAKYCENQDLDNVNREIYALRVFRDKYGKKRWVRNRKGRQNYQSQSSVCGPQSLRSKREMARLVWNDHPIHVEVGSGKGLRIRNGQAKSWHQLHRDWYPKSRYWVMPWQGAWSWCPTSSCCG